MTKGLIVMLSVQFLLAVTAGTDDGFLGDFFKRFPNSPFKKLDSSSSMAKEEDVGIVEAMTMPGSNREGRDTMSGFNQVPDQQFLTFDPYSSAPAAPATIEEKTTEGAVGGTLDTPNFWENFIASKIQKGFEEEQQQRQLATSEVKNFMEVEEQQYELLPKELSQNFIDDFRSEVPVQQNYLNFQDDNNNNNNNNNINNNNVVVEVNRGKTERLEPVLRPSKPWFPNDVKEDNFKSHTVSAEEEENPNIPGYLATTERSKRSKKIEREFLDRMKRLHKNQQQSSRPSPSSRASPTAFRPSPSPSSAPGSSKEEEEDEGWVPVLPMPKPTPSVPFADRHKRQQQQKRKRGGGGGGGRWKAVKKVQ